MDNKFTERLYQLGGFKTYYASRAESIVSQIEREQHLRQRYRKGAGFGFDFNGFAGGHQGPLPDGTPPRVIYPFTGFDGVVSIDRQVSGDRIYDFSEDGLAHYGLVPDYVEDIRVVGGKGALADFIYGAESYLRTWQAAADHASGDGFIGMQPIPITPEVPYFLAANPKPKTKRKNRKKKR